METDSYLPPFEQHKQHVKTTIVMKHKTKRIDTIMIASFDPKSFTIKMVILFKSHSTPP